MAHRHSIVGPGQWSEIGHVQALSQIPRERAEWVVWIDMDVMLGDIGFTFPLTKEAYADKDLIVWGNYDAVLAGDTYNGQASFSSVWAVRALLASKSKGSPCDPDFGRVPACMADEGLRHSGARLSCQVWTAQRLSVEHEQESPLARQGQHGSGRQAT